MAFKVEKYREEQVSRNKLVYEWKIWDICVPHLLENSLMMFDTQNYERHFPVKWWPFFKTKWPLLVVFCSLVSLVNKIQLVKAI